MSESLERLKAALERRVVHRDIKAENVTLSGHHARVTDFGVSKAVSEPNVDQRADIYAVGVLAYELLAERPPFSGATAQQILRMIHPMIVTLVSILCGASCSDGSSSLEPPIAAQCGEVTLALGDSFAGPVVPNSVKYQVPLGTGEAADVRLTWDDDDHTASDWVVTIRAPGGDILATDEALQSRMFRTWSGHHTGLVWGAVTGSEPGCLTVAVVPRLFPWESPPPQYVLATRRSGPIVTVAKVTDWEKEGPWDEEIVDTILVENAGRGSAEWAVFDLHGGPTEARYSFVPDGGLLPTSGPTAVTVHFDPSGLTGQGAVGGWYALFAPVADEWAGGQMSSGLFRAYDPRFKRAFDLPEVDLYDMVAHPDGSLLVATEKVLPVDSTGLPALAHGIIKVNLGTGTWSAVPFLAESERWRRSGGGAARLSLGPDGSLWVANQEGAIYRIRPDGSQQTVWEATTTVWLWDIEASPDGSLFVSGGDIAQEGLWTVDTLGVWTNLIKGEPHGDYCHSLAYDGAAGLLYMVTPFEELVTYAPDSGTITSVSPSMGGSGTLVVGRSGVVYSRLDSGLLGVFDPTTGTWSEPLIMPRSDRRGIAVVEGRVIAGVEMGGLVGLLVEDGPASAP